MTILGILLQMHLDSGGFMPEGLAIHIYIYMHVYIYIVSRL